MVSICLQSNDFCIRTILYVNNNLCAVKIFIGFYPNTNLSILEEQSKQVKW